MLKKVASVGLPPHMAGGFDHADVHRQSGKVYIAHTANSALEVVDGEGMRHLGTIPGCVEASGVLCAQEEGMVFGAARGAGKVLMVDTGLDVVTREIHAGSTPNGLAWDSLRKHLLVADVKDNQARILDPSSGGLVSSVPLRGRPRWCLYDKTLDVFLVNIRDPPGIEVISPEAMAERKFVPVSVQGPHGLETVEGSGLAYVACDGAALVTLDLDRDKEISRVPLSGAPDVLWLNHRRNLLYCAIGDPGVVDVIDIDKAATVETVPTEEGAHTLTFDSERQRLYVLLPKTNGVAIFLQE